MGWGKLGKEKTRKREIWSPGDLWPHPIHRPQAGSGASPSSHTRSCHFSSTLKMFSLPSSNLASSGRGGCRGERVGSMKVKALSASNELEQCFKSTRKCTFTHNKLAFANYHVTFFAFDWNCIYSAGNPI